MHLIKPSWVVHPDESRQAQPPTTLYTLALHPDQTRLATGGLDTKIRVWSTAPILNEQDEQRDDMPKLLSTLTSHSGDSHPKITAPRSVQRHTHIADSSDVPFRRCHVPSLAK